MVDQHSTGFISKGLDPKNLEISVMAGKATMKNLKLKSSVLDKLELPIVVKEGLCTSFSYSSSRFFGVS
jgi:hypothetical protein